MTTTKATFVLQKCLHVTSELKKTVCICSFHVVRNLLALFTKYTKKKHYYVFILCKRCVCISRILTSKC